MSDGSKIYPITAIPYCSEKLTLVQLQLALNGHSSDINEENTDRVKKI